VEFLIYIGIFIIGLFIGIIIGVEMLNSYQRHLSQIKNTIIESRPINSKLEEEILDEFNQNF
jgi:hypothetical protein|tara:strand:- start:561 stop:746 length:186 start_codon:yes stop_codon:yes gene_type:complete